MIFWDNTHDYNCNCVGDDELVHMGIVQKVNIDGEGTLHFIHASTKDGVVGAKQMNLTIPSKNTALRLANKPSCCTCATGENCPAIAGCKKGKKPYTCTEEQWDEVPKRSDQLFRGYGTVRNLK